VPFYINENYDKRSLMVVIKPSFNQVDLYDREREKDSKKYIDVKKV